MIKDNEPYYFLTKPEYEKLINLINQYIDYNKELFCDKCTEKKYHIDNEICGLHIWDADQNNYSEIKIGNTYIHDNTLTCIFDNQIHKYKIINRPANKGDLALIIAPCLADGDTKGKYINHVFKVDDRTNNEGWTKECSIVRINDNNQQGWCLYDDQYVVLESIESCTN